MSTPRARWLGMAALACAVFTAPAHADLLFRFYNQSPIPAKGIVHNLSILWLKPGQNEVARATGIWGQIEPCPIWGCPTSLQNSYEVHFEHLSDSNTRYCTWTVNYRVERQVVNVVGKRDGLKTGKVHITPKLVHQEAGFACAVGGQMSAGWSSEKQGDGAELYFYVKKSD